MRPIKLKCSANEDEILRAYPSGDHGGDMMVCVDNDEGVANSVRLTPAQITQLRDALTEWLEGCNHG